MALTQVQPDFDPEHELALIAEQQAGAFTRQQALTAGFGPGAIEWRLRHRVWRRIRRGVYASTDQLGRLDGAGLHLLAASAQMLAMVGELAVSHRSAAAVHRLPCIGEPPTAPVLTRPARGAWESSTSPLLRLAPLPLEHVVMLRGVRVTSPARTVIDVARESGLSQGLLVADAALRAGLSRVALAQVAAFCRLWPGAHAANDVVRLADPRAESALESLGRVGMYTQGVPAGELQLVVIRDGVQLARTDHGWPALRVIGEADGMAKYDSGAVLRAEKLRQERLEDCGLTVFRYTWAEALHRPKLLADRFWRAVEVASHRTLRPGVQLLPTGDRRW